MMQRQIMRESPLLLLVLYIYTAPRMMVNRQFYLINDKFVRQGSNQCDSFERLSPSKINPGSAQETISGFILHRLDCSTLSH
jgi:hypothetical protein